MLASNLKRKTFIEKAHRKVGFFYALKTGRYIKLNHNQIYQREWKVHVQGALMQSHYIKAILHTLFCFYCCRCRLAGSLNGIWYEVLMLAALAEQEMVVIYINFDEGMF